MDAVMEREQVQELLKEERPQNFARPKREFKQMDARRLAFYTEMLNPKTASLAHETRRLEKYPA